MKRNPKKALFRFYAKLNVNKEIHKAIRFFHEWKQAALKMR